MSASHGSAFGKWPSRRARTIPPTMVTVARTGIRNVIFGVNRRKKPARCSGVMLPTTGPTMSPTNRSIPVQSTPVITWTYVRCLTSSVASDAASARNGTATTAPANAGFAWFASPLRPRRGRVVVSTPPIPGRTGPGL
jgi:hypothetical protein